MTYRPLSSNHPSALNNFPVFPNSPEGISRVLESQFEAVGYLRMGGRFRRFTLACE